MRTDASKALRLGDDAKDLAARLLRNETGKRRWSDFNRPLRFQSCLLVFAEGKICRGFFEPRECPIPTVLCPLSQSTPPTVLKAKGAVLRSGEYLP